MQRLTNQSMPFLVNDLRVVIYWTKVKALHLHCLPYIWEMMQVSIANESVSECSRTGLCIKSKRFTDVVTRKHIKCHLNVPGVQFFRLQIRTKISHSLELYQIQLNEMIVFDRWHPEMWGTYQKCVLIVYPVNYSTSSERDDDVPR